MIDSVLEAELLDNPVQNETTKGKRQNYMAIPSSSKRFNRLVETDIYYTRGKVGEGIDCYKTETTSIFCGKRPDLDAIVRETREEAIQLGVKHVHVVCCGPTSLLAATREACRRYNSLCCGKGVQLDLHEEIFEF